MASPIAVGARFDGLEALKQACRELAIDTHFEFLTSHSNKSRYTIACKAENCHWRLHATSIGKTPAFQIKTLHSDHSCYRINHSGNNAATATFVAKYVAENLKQQPDYCPIDIVKDIQCE